MENIPTPLPAAFALRSAIFIFEFTETPGLEDSHAANLSDWRWKLPESEKWVEEDMAFIDEGCGRAKKENHASPSKDEFGETKEIDSRYTEV